MGFVTDSKDSLNDNIFAKGGNIKTVKRRKTKLKDYDFKVLNKKELDEIRIQAYKYAF